MPQRLTINFYRVSPDSDLLPVLRRTLGPEDSIEEWETLLKVPTRDTYQRFALLSRWPFTGDQAAYTTHEMRFDALPRQTRIRLLDDSLAQSFRKRGLEVMRRKFSFSVHEKDSAIACSVAGITLRRGVEFQLDSVFIGDRRQFGYFITLKVSRSFSVDLTNSKLQKAASGQQVYVGDAGEDAKAILISVSGDDATVQLSNGPTRTVSAASVRVPASYEIVKRYLLELGLGSDSFGQLLTREQEAAMRRTPKGQRRRDALKAQGDYVSTWLINNSDYGRLRFTWAFSDANMSLVTTQHAVKRVEEF